MRFRRRSNIIRFADVSEGDRIEYMAGDKSPVGHMTITKIEGMDRTGRFSVYGAYAGHGLAMDPDTPVKVLSHEKAWWRR